MASALACKKIIRVSEVVLYPAAQITIGSEILPYRMVIISNYFPITAYRVEGQNNYFRYTKNAKTVLSANLACPKIPGMCIFWKQKAPAGWLLT